ncbi:MAG: hypothetical protein ACRD0R_00385, partial [Acidimicrobiales bacterium]
LEVPSLAVVCVEPSRCISEVKPERPKQVLALDELSDQGGCAVLMSLAKKYLRARHQLGADLSDEANSYERSAARWVRVGLLGRRSVHHVSRAEPGIHANPGPNVFELRGNDLAILLPSRCRGVVCD